MKKSFLFILTLFLSLNAFSQRKNSEKIKALKVAYITDKLDLTSSEAEKFWPIYNKFQDENEKLRTKMGSIRKNGSSANNKNITEEEAKKILFSAIDIETQKSIITKNYITELLNILPAKKVLLVMSSEKEFRRKMIEEFKGRHREKRQKFKENRD